MVKALSKLNRLFRSAQLSTSFKNEYSLESDGINLIWSYALLLLPVSLYSFILSSKKWIGYNKLDRKNKEMI